MRFFVFLMALAWIGEDANATTAVVPGPSPSLYRGVRANALGNAFIAIADDQEAIFYNPAGLAGQTRMTMNYFDFTAEASQNAISAARSTSTLFKNFDANSMNVLMGRNISGRLQFTPNFTMPNFGLSLIVDAQAAAYLQDRSYPNVLLGYQITNGLQAATGISLLKPGKRQKSDIRVGVAGKMLWRRGGYQTLSPLDLLHASEQGKSYVNTLAGNFGVGFGMDLGAQYFVKVDPRSTLSAGFTYTDIGGTRFAAKNTAPIPQSISLGTAWKFEIPKAKSRFTLAYDVRDINKSIDWRMKNHLGAEFAVPVFKFQAGLNQLHLSYGVGMDLWFLNVEAASTEEDIGVLSGQNTSRSYLFRIALKFTI